MEDLQIQMRCLQNDFHSVEHSPHDATEQSPHNTPHSVHLIPPLGYPLSNLQCDPDLYHFIRNLTENMWFNI